MSNADAAKEEIFMIAHKELNGEGPRGPLVQIQADLNDWYYGFVDGDEDRQTMFFSLELQPGEQFHCACTDECEGKLHWWLVPFSEHDLKLAPTASIISMESVFRAEDEIGVWRRALKNTAYQDLLCKMIAIITLGTATYGADFNGLWDDVEFEKQMLPLSAGFLSA